METSGTTLRQIRLHWGLSLREVMKRSSTLAKEWGSPSYEISGSWLARLEGGKHDMTVPKLISLATIYSMPPEELLRHCHQIQSKAPQLEQFTKTNTTVPLKRGITLDQQTWLVLPDNFECNPAPEETTLLPLETNPASTPYRRAVIGRRDQMLEPMIRPGSILKIDTQKRSIASRKEWTNEFDRPIYLLLMRTGYACSWCELDNDGIWLTSVSHPLSPEHCRHWRYRKEVEVIGRVIAVAMRL